MMAEHMVPFVVECCGEGCGVTLSVKWLQYDALSPAAKEQFNKYHKVVSHGLCPACYQKTMVDVEQTVSDTVNLTIEDLELLLREEN